MHIATVRLESLSAYSQSKPHKTAKKSKEGADAYEARTWQNRLHLDSEGVLIPAMCFKNCLSEAAKFLSIQIPGKGKATYTKHFEAGILVATPSPIYHPKTGNRIVPPSDLGLLQARLSNQETVSEEDEKALQGFERKPNEVWGDWIFTPADGVPGSGKRVWKCYPMIDAWTCEVVFTILDDVITEDVFTNVLTQAGQLIGIGRFRVRNRGTYGRFAVKEVNWQEI
jgi:hypothetical protein